jgi:hypothetical protein
VLDRGESPLSNTCIIPTPGAPSGVLDHFRRDRAPRGAPVRFVCGSQMLGWRPLRGLATTSSGGLTSSKTRTVSGSKDPYALTLGGCRSQLGRFRGLDDRNPERFAARRPGWPKSEIQGFCATPARRSTTPARRLHDAGLGSGCASSKCCIARSRCCKTYHVTGGRDKNDAASPPADVPSRSSPSGPDFLPSSAEAP